MSGGGREPVIIITGRRHGWPLGSGDYRGEMKTEKKERRKRPSHGCGGKRSDRFPKKVTEASKVAALQRLEGGRPRARPVLWPGSQR